MKFRTLSALSLAGVLALTFSPAIQGQVGMQDGQGSMLGADQAGPRHRSRSVESAARGVSVLPDNFGELKLAPGFLITLDVLDDADLSGDFRIDQDGDLMLPGLGRVHVEGETASEAASQIQQLLLTRHIMLKPQVNLDVLQYTVPQVTIVGEVTSPGRYPLIAPENLVDVLALAGGTLVTASNEITITHATERAHPILIHYFKDADTKQIGNVVVDPGDTVQVRRAGVIYVLGAVTRPGGYVMQEHGSLSLLEAVSLANGTSLSASVRTIYVLRRQANGAAVTISLPYDRIAHGRRSDFALNPRDIVYVPTSKVKTLMINGAGILAAAASASIYAAVIY
jgi:polysaccharide export outer membrane protein